MIPQGSQGSDCQKVSKQRSSSKGDCSLKSLRSTFHLASIETEIQKHSVGELSIDFLSCKSDGRSLL